MRNYTYKSRIVTELYCKDNMSRCVVTTLYYDDSIVSHLMWMRTKVFEAAMDGNQEVKGVIDRAYENLVKEWRI